MTKKLSIRPSNQNMKETAKKNSLISYTPSSTKIIKKSHSYKPTEDMTGLYYLFYARLMSCDPNFLFFENNTAKNCKNDTFKKKNIFIFYTHENHFN